MLWNKKNKRLLKKSTEAWRQEKVDLKIKSIMRERWKIN